VRLFRLAVIPAIALASIAATAMVASSRGAAESKPISATLYEFDVVRDWLTMPDGVRLAVTYFRPRPRTTGEKFPVLFEMIPYRKEDGFYFRDYGIYSYIVRRGFIMAKVDIRGTGSSEGQVPDREYSAAELNDAVTIIDQLSRLPGGNGKVGMWGKSWGGFNSLQVAMRQPPALKAIVALHASDDLYHDDIHFIDGVMHVDPYALQIDHMNGLPRPPQYPLDASYFRDRFEQPPWIFTYLRHTVDDDWWRSGSLLFHIKRLTIPTYLIGGLLDGYRDTPPRLLDSLRIPLKVEIGPWDHAYPDEGLPAPDYEWRERMADWFGYWLRGDKTPLMDEPRFMTFVRDYQRPDINTKQSNGHWRFEDWPIARTKWQTLNLSHNGRLTESHAEETVDQLAYDATYGTTGGDWWGDRTGDMRPDDAGSLVYDGTPLDKPIEIIGRAKVALTVESSAELANWSVRLEDVAPTGEVALVTGASLNGTQILSRTAPKRLTPGKRYDATIELHYTTWTFPAGHRIRVAVTNAQFPILWPSPYPMTTKLYLGGGMSVLRLPTIPAATTRAPNLPAPVARLDPPDGRRFPDSSSSSRRTITDALLGTTTWELRNTSAYTIADRHYKDVEGESYVASREHPDRSTFLGDYVEDITVGKRALRLHTVMDVRSDSLMYRARFTREIFENGRSMRRREWADSVNRVIH
jgi:predicted acyl esterase